jgi:hypothetical protein
MKKRNGPYAARGPFTCEKCGKAYETHRPPGEGERYCSRPCAYAARQAAPAFSQVGPHECRVCGREWIGRGRGVLCSDMCRAMDRVRSNALARAATQAARRSYVAPASNGEEHRSRVRGPRDGRRLAVDGGRVFALVDRRDISALVAYRWRLGKDGYVYRKSRGKRIMLHHVVIGRPRVGFVTDHRSRNKLDNRRVNLRHIPRDVSQQNVGPQRRNPTGVRGVTVADPSGRFKAVVGRVVLGYFADVQAAAAAASAYRSKHLPYSIEG